LKAASLLVAAGDRDRYHQLCIDTLDRFGTSGDISDRERIAKICSILPQNDASLMQRAQEIQDAIGPNPRVVNKLKRVF
jgi:hypothetical protein